MLLSYVRKKVDAENKKKGNLKKEKKRGRKKTPKLKKKLFSFFQNAAIENKSTVNTATDVRATGDALP